MDKLENNGLLTIIANIYDESKDSKLSKQFFKKIDPSLTELAEYLQITKIQSLIFANIFVINYIGCNASIDLLSDHFKCNPLLMLNYRCDFESLLNEGFLIKSSTKHWAQLPLANCEYVITENISHAIIFNLPKPETKQERTTDIVDVLEKLYSLGLERDDKKISTHQLFEETKSILEETQGYSLIKNLKLLNLVTSDSYLFLYLCWKRVDGHEVVDLSTAINGIFDKNSNRLHYTQMLLAKENKLLEQELVEIEENQFANDINIKLTPKAIEMLQNEGIKLKSSKMKGENILCPENIPFKQLYFNDNEKKQLDMLGNMLMDENLEQLKSRLADKNLPNGITVLLHGAPGTGKTETVYQIAKRNNREIMNVDISQSKSMWFGESEKIIKRIFTDYNKFTKQNSRCPILLFNEADAIISKRKDGGYSNIAQTENSIQNIILEELEKFNGILFATTNLVNNLDKAFERRFLFKVEFFKPELIIRTQIWQSKLKSATQKECSLLANQFDFSGAQIDNIVRKSEMSEILNGKKPNLDQIINYCHEETITNGNNKQIGFLSKQN